MSDASTFPITELYGCRTGYPLNQNLCPPGQGFHNGVDYGCPVGTPVVVNGVQIGLSGATGAVTGPHLHVGRWVGGKSTPIGPGDGFNVNGGTVSEVGHDPTNGNFVRVADADGSNWVSWVYLHLSEQNVTVGQQLKGGNMSDIPADLDTTKRLVNNFFGSSGPEITSMGGFDKVVNDNQGSGVVSLITAFANSPQNQQYRTRISNALTATPSDAQNKLNQIKAIIG